MQLLCQLSALNWKRRELARQHREAMRIDGQKMFRAGGTNTVARWQMRQQFIVQTTGVKSPAATSGEQDALTNEVFSHKVKQWIVSIWM